jgi:DNA-directed RNA polymerase subunit M/transcription elongation factor TFIIS
MYYFKACNKCQGDLYLASDSYGSFLKCLQCGRITELENRGSSLFKADARNLKKQAA